MKDRASRIRYLRTQAKPAKMTQAALAREIGVDRAAVTNWEGGGGISRENLKKVADYFRISIDWIEQGTGEPPSNIRPDTPKIEARRAELPNVCPYTRDEAIEAIRFALAGLGVPGFSPNDCLEFAETVIGALEAPPSGIPGMSKLDKARSRIEDAIEKFSTIKRREGRADA